LKLVKAVRYQNARENTPRNSVDRKDIEAVLPLLPQTVADMLRLQLLTAMRPSEVRNMTAGQIKRDYDGENWLYLPEKHKTAWRGKSKAVIFGKSEQEILLRYIDFDDLTRPVFQNVFGLMFSDSRLTQILNNAFKWNPQLTKFTPYQLRHTAITEISETYGRDVARAVAGHSSEAMTQIYDHSDVKKALLVVTDRQKSVAEASNSVNAAFARPTLRIFTGD
jgi:integrase